MSFGLFGKDARYPRKLSDHTSKINQPGKSNRKKVSQTSKRKKPKVSIDTQNIDAEIDKKDADKEMAIDMFKLGKLLSYEIQEEEEPTPS